MAQHIIQALEEIARTVKNSQDVAKVKQAIEVLRQTVQETKEKQDKDSRVLLERLESELATWLTKLEVILKEPIGRQGIEKHSRHWIEILKKGVSH